MMLFCLRFLLNGNEVWSVCKNCKGSKVDQMLIEFSSWYQWWMGYGDIHHAVVSCNMLVCLFHEWREMDHDICLPFCGCLLQGLILLLLVPAWWDCGIIPVGSWWYCMLCLFDWLMQEVMVIVLLPAVFVTAPCRAVLTPAPASKARDELRRDNRRMMDGIGD